MTMIESDDITPFVQRFVQFCDYKRIPRRPWIWTKAETALILKLLFGFCFKKVSSSILYDKYSSPINGYQLSSALLNPTTLKDIPKKIRMLLQRTVLPMAVKSILTDKEGDAELKFEETIELNEEKQKNNKSRDFNNKEISFDQPLSVDIADTPDCDSIVHDDFDLNDLSDGELDELQDEENYNEDDDDDDDESTSKLSGIKQHFDTEVKVDPKLCMLDKIQAIEKHLDDFQEKLTQYNHDIKTIEQAAGPTRPSDLRALGMECEDDDIGNKWIDNGHGLLPFIHTCLQDPRLKHVVQWVEQGREFEIVDLAKLAEMWGKEKKKEGMTKRKITRSLSYLIKQKGKLIRSQVNKSVYQIVTPDRSICRRTTPRRDSTSSNDSERSTDQRRFSKPTMAAHNLKELLEDSRKRCEKQNAEKLKLGPFSNAEKLFPSVLRSKNIPNTNRKRGYESTPASPMTHSLLQVRQSQSLPASPDQQNDQTFLPTASNEPRIKISRSNESFLQLLTSQEKNQTNTRDKLNSTWPRPSLKSEMMKIQDNNDIIFSLSNTEGTSVFESEKHNNSHVMMGSSLTPQSNTPMTSMPVINQFKRPVTTNNFMPTQQNPTTLNNQSFQQSLHLVSTNSLCLPPPFTMINSSTQSNVQSFTQTNSFVQQTNSCWAPNNSFTSQQVTMPQDLTTITPMVFGTATDNKLGATNNTNLFQDEIDNNFLEKYL